MVLPNKHYIAVDLSRFPRHLGGGEDNNEVFLPAEKPFGNIELTMGKN